MFLKGGGSIDCLLLLTFLCIRVWMFCANECKYNQRQNRV
jgi:hypothetical protein